jgi:hypothetical protein
MKKESMKFELLDGALGVGVYRVTLKPQEEK